MLFKNFIMNGKSAYIIVPKNFIKMINLNPDTEEIVLRLKEDKIILSKDSSKIEPPKLTKKFYKNGNSNCILISSDLLKMWNIDPKKSKVGLNIVGSDIVIKILPKDETEGNN